MHQIRRTLASALAALATLVAAGAAAQESAPPEAADELVPQAPAPQHPGSFRRQAPFPESQQSQYPQPQYPQPRYPQPQSLYPQAGHASYPSYYVPRSSRDRRIVGYRRAQRNPPSVWGAGLAIFLAGYVLDFAVLTPVANAISVDRSADAEQDAWAWSLIPIAGPIIQLGVGAPHPAIPIATGLMQIGGLVAFIIGLATEETVNLPVYEGGPDDPSMLRVGLDAAQIEGGAEMRLTLTHL